MEDDARSGEEGHGRAGAVPAAEGGVGAGRPRACCSVCMEPCTCYGAHRICCIPCGHMYGRSCLLRWLIQSSQEAAAKCPQCGKQYKCDSLIDLYMTTEHLWDDCHHEQASRQGVMEEEASLENVMKSAVEAIAWKDAAIARRDKEIVLKDEAIAKSHEVIALKDEEIALRDKIIALKDKVIIALRKILK